MPTPHGPETCYTTALPYSTVRFHSPRRYMHECRQFISRTQPHSHFSVHRRDYRARPRAQRTLKFFIEPPPSALASGLSARHLTLLCFRTDPASLRELGACATRNVYEASPCNMLKVNSLCKKRVIHIRTHTLSCLLPTMSIIPVPWCIARHSIPTRVRGSGAAQGMPPQRPSAAPLQAAAAATAAAATAARRASAFSALAAILRCHG